MTTKSNSAPPTKPDATGKVEAVAHVLKIDSQGTATVGLYDDSLKAGTQLYTHPPADVERDAARYRWLRLQHWNDTSMCVVTDPKRNVKLGSDCPAVDRLDEAIDAAMTRADDGGSAEICESGQPECGPVTHHDSEGVPLCEGCWDALADNENDDGSLG